MTALRNADAAGDSEAATRIAAMIKAQSVPQESINPDVPASGDAPAFPAQPEKEPLTLTEKLVAPLEAGATIATGATTGAIGYASGALEGAARNIVGDMTQQEAQDLAAKRAAALTYEPKGRGAKKILESASSLTAALPPVIGITPISTLRSAIPNKAITEAAIRTPKAKKALLKQQIASGNPNIETVAKVLNEKGDIVTNKQSKNLIKTLGGGERAIETVSVLENLDPASKKQALKMLDIIEKGKKEPLFGAENRASDIVGQSVANRAKAISTINEKASKQIGNIARSQKNKPVNIQTPVDNFLSELSDMGVTFSKGDDGWINPDFSRSKFVGGNQKDMSVLINELAQGNINFEQAHKIKRTIRDNVDYDKLGAGQIKGDSERLLKSLSSEIDNVLDNESPAYKKANERFAKTIKLKDEFQKMAGKDIDLFGDLSGEALSNKARRLSSNAASRTAIRQTMTNADETLKDLGVNFKDNISALNFVTNRLDDIFKTTPDTSMQGVLERASSAGDAVVSPVSATKQGLMKIKEMTEPDFNKKINSIRTLLKKG